MRARKRRTVEYIFSAVMAGAILLAVTACGIAASAAGGKASRAGHAGSPRPGAASKVRFSRVPRTARLTPPIARPSRHRKITSGHADRVTVTASDNGATVVVSRGQQIRVVLTGQGTLTWHRPSLAASAPGVLRLLNASGGYPSRLPARATYRAALTGTTQIVSITDARCLHAHPPCAFPQRSWQVTIIVR